MSDEEKNLKLGFKNTKTITLKSSFASRLKGHNSINQEESRITKKQKFESFLTHRKRLSRLAIVQGIYFYEQFLKFNTVSYTKEEEVNEAYRTVIYFYKRMFFHQKYGDNKKNKKLEERFVRLVITNYVINAERIDALITKYLAKKWKINRLNSLIRSGLRASVSEVLFSQKRQYKIIVSEYTDLIARVVSEEKEVAFFNAILDNIIKEIKEDYGSKQ